MNTKYEEVAYGHLFSAASQLEWRRGDAGVERAEARFVETSSTRACRVVVASSDDGPHANGPHASGEAYATRGWPMGRAARAEESAAAGVPTAAALGVSDARGLDVVPPRDNRSRVSGKVSESRRVEGGLHG